MESNFHLINNLFSRLTGYDKKIILSSNIYVNNSENVTISDNHLNPSVTLVIDGFAHDCKNIIDTPINVNFSPSIVKDKTDRAQLNIDYIERFIFACNQQTIIPTIRCYAFFSHVSSIRSREDSSDYNQLVLAEKDLFDKMLELKYHIKLIISLDIPIILTKWYDNILETIERITDLSDKVDNVCEKNNIEIVIDEMNSLDGQFILHNCLFIHALNSDPVQKYNITKYETDKRIIRNAIIRYDQRFNYLHHVNHHARKLLRNSSMSKLINYILDSSTEYLNKEWSNYV